MPNEEQSQPGAATPDGRARRAAQDAQRLVRRNPEASWPVHTYRRVLPVRVRRGVARVVSREVRAQVKEGLSAWSGSRPQLGNSVAERAIRRHPQGLLEGARTLGRVHGVPKVLLIGESISPLRARNDNAASVCEALERAEVDYFWVRGRRDDSAVIAVPERDRGLVHEALAALCERLPGYVSVMDGRAGTPRESAPGFAAATWRRLSEAKVIRLTWYRTDPSGRLVLGAKYGCDVEFWAEDEGRLHAPRPQPVADTVDLADPPVRTPGSLFTRLASPATALPAVRTRREFAAPRPDDIRFPVDVVYTWVDGQDPAWLRRRQEAQGQPYHEEAANTARFASRDELRYSLRSVHQYAPWVRNIYLVTDDQRPSWLDTEAEGLTLVSHRDIFRDPEALPTFNSHAIESQLHHIDGLSEHFLYFNDDMFLGRPVVPQDFFHANGLTKFFPSPALIPMGEPDGQDVPVSAAGKNNRTLLDSRFQTVITHKMKHIPYPLRRSVLAEIEATFAERHRTTAGNRFRGLDDLSIASSFHHYYAYQTSRAVPGRLTYSYVDLAHPDTERRLGRLLARRDRQTFCLNDTVSGEADVESQQRFLGPFLEAYFPVPGPYELRDEPGR
ncbi:stealth family protein [Streptomyces clavuligerus]|uniref:Exopolysaccharide phosphotransferase n=1 Tax=Streptomyces clavuligerus TaxID=1901 RepID=E2PZF8_STRCL|nr:stealth family protein [Streptomyces clavuligerus]ANW17128.1 sugar phosphotransferase [Streptomyces clavuligerus]AXU11668.1 sugar phosphotransferase [Streptomyces clavuligerus]EFG10419.1 Exopolysaccharide phosphotransferase [Streptomyces clavuligerus]MBY6301507.1 stealth family protein [Streptomyces clavuligerus]QCS04448.1 sugar phosphotransferase [Streptomyces clavuligerus]